MLLKLEPVTTPVPRLLAAKFERDNVVVSLIFPPIWKVAKPAMTSPQSWAVVATAFPEVVREMLFP